MRVVLFGPLPIIAINTEIIPIKYANLTLAHQKNTLPGGPENNHLKIFRAYKKWTLMTKVPKTTLRTPVISGFFFGTTLYTLFTFVIMPFKLDMDQLPMLSLKR